MTLPDNKVIPYNISSPQDLVQSPNEGSFFLKNLSNKWVKKSVRKAMEKLILEDAKLEPQWREEKIQDLIDTQGGREKSQRNRKPS